MRTVKKVVLVTGASAGIGKATARILSQNGWIVYAAARRLEAMNDIADERVKIVQLDITDEWQCGEVIHRIIRDEGQIDALVNNAGYGFYGPLEEVTDEEARHQFDVNIFGLMHLTRLVLPQMREQKAGNIINISSIGGRMATPMGGWYHATKFALEGLSDTLRAEVKPFGISVTVIQPGNVTSEWASVAAENLEKESSSSPYHKMIKAMSKSLIDGVNATKGILAAAPPETIGQLIIKILESKHPKTRYAAPFHARLFLFLRWLLGDHTFDRIMENQISKHAK